MNLRSFLAMLMMGLMMPAAYCNQVDSTVVEQRLARAQAEQQNPTEKSNSAVTVESAMMARIEYKGIAYTATFVAPNILLTSAFVATELSEAVKANQDSKITIYFSHTKKGYPTDLKNVFKSWKKGDPMPSEDNYAFLRVNGTYHKELPTLSVPGSLLNKNITAVYQGKDLKTKKETLRVLNEAGNFFTTSNKQSKDSFVPVVSPGNPKAIIGFSIMSNKTKNLTYFLKITDKMIKVLNKLKEKYPAKN